MKIGWIALMILVIKCFQLIRMNWLLKKRIAIHLHSIPRNFQLVTFNRRVFEFQYKTNCYYFNRFL